MNIKATMRSVRQEDAQLRQQLHSPVNVDGPAASFVKPTLPPAPASMTFGPRAAPISGNPSSASEAPSTAPVAASTASATPSVDSCKRGSPSCGKCGHLRFDGPDRLHHNKDGSYSVPCDVRLEIKHPKLSGAKNFGEGTIVRVVWGIWAGASLWCDVLR